MEITYDQLWNNICHLSAELSHQGIKPGDRVVVILPNNKEFVYLLLACFKMGAIVVPLQPVFGIREYKEMFDEVEPSIVMTTTFVFTKVLAFESTFLEKYRFIICDEDSWVKSKYENVFSYKDIMSAQSSQEIQENINENISTASINYTYRGYGYPLGAELTHDNYLNSVEMINENELLHGRRYLSALPMAHIFSLVSYVLMPLLKGRTVVILKSHSSWEFIKAIEELKIDVVYGVPTFYTYLLKSFDRLKFNLSCVKCGISGGSFLSAQMHSELEKGLGIKIFQGYGLTEALIVSVNTAEKNKIPSLGPAVHQMDIKIVNEEGTEVALGEKGEIVVKGPSVMKGYYKKEKDTERVLNDGWLYTGDYGKKDENGFIYFEGLKKRVAKVGGHIVDLKEVEKVILTHPHVQTTEVFSEHSSFWGETVTVEILTGMATTEEEIISFCNPRLAAYKIPKKIKLINKEGLRILVVDNDIELQCNYLFDLNQEGYKVTVVDAAFKAIEELKSGFYDFIITELVLPDKQGEELLYKLKTINDNTSIIIITQHQDILNALDLSEFNMAGHLIKPFLKEDLLDIIKK